MSSSKWIRAVNAANDVYLRTDYSSDHENEREVLTAHVARIPDSVLKLLGDDFDDSYPQEDHKLAFKNRPPGMGLTPADIAGLKAFDAAEGSLPRDRQRVFRQLRSRMMLQCVNCDGASTLTELSEALEAELKSGKPSHVPTWLSFGNISREELSESGPRSMGLRRCVARGCFHVETETLRLKKCGKCLARYCSVRCQVADWRDRHKRVCSTAAEISPMTRAMLSNPGHRASMSPDLLAYLDPVTRAGMSPGSRDRMQVMTSMSVPTHEVEAIFARYGRGHHRHSH
jgi:hypothetical protein